MGDKENFEYRISVDEMNNYLFYNYQNINLERFILLAEDNKVYQFKNSYIRSRKSDLVFFVIAAIITTNFPYIYLRDIPYSDIKTYTANSRINFVKTITNYIDFISKMYNEIDDISLFEKKLLFNYI